MKKIAFVLIVALVCFGNTALAQIDMEDMFPADEDALASAFLVNSDGLPLGGVVIAAIEQIPDALGIWVFIWEGLEPGYHAFHIHSVGTCDEGENFTTAGGHFNPAGGDHGTHAGDLPSIYAMANGGGGTFFITDAFTVEDLMDDDGSAFMIHAGRDNYGNVPERYGSPDGDTLAAGDAGPRVGCGVIEAGFIFQDE
jgi:Cu-Zn family superoxide dismutase